MKRTNAIWTIALLIMTGLAGCKQSATQSDDLITVDVTKNYSKKDLILQDFMDVEYIALETNDEFLTQGFVLDIGKDIIIVKNRVNSGDIFIFDRKGKAIKKINRLGQGGQEYTYILGVTLDEDNGEIFVNDHYVNKLLVYDLDGNFKRSFNHKEGSMYDRIYNFDRENLICHDGSFDNDGVGNKQSFTVISKQDGSIIKEIQIPYEKQKSTILTAIDEAQGMVYSAGPRNQELILYNSSSILVEPSSDTIYRFQSDYSMIPFFVRTPSIQSMDPEIFLFPGVLTDRYYFLQTVKKEFNFETSIGFPITDLMYDKQEKSIFEYIVYNDDYSNKKTVNLGHEIFFVNSNEVAFLQKLEAHELIEDYENGKLKGKLKELAATLDEESNPVIMLIKHKK